MIGHYKVSCLCLAYGTKPVCMDFFCSWSIMALDMEFFYWPLDRDVFCNLWFIFWWYQDAALKLASNTILWQPIQLRIHGCVWLIYDLFIIYFHMVCIQCGVWLSNNSEHWMRCNLWLFGCCEDSFWVAWFVGKNL